MRVAMSTTVGIDDPGFDESHFEVVQNCRLMQVAESCQVVLSHQDVWVSKRRELQFRRINGVVVVLKQESGLRVILTILNAFQVAYM